MGLSFGLLFSATPTGAGDCFLYIKNQSGVYDICVEGFSLWLAADEYIDVKLGDTGTPVGGTTITPINLNTGSGTVVSGTFQNGNDITGLSSGVTVNRIYHASSQASVYTNFEQDLILKPNGVLTMYCQTGTTVLHGTLDLNVHDGVM